MAFLDNLARVAESATFSGAANASATATLTGVIASSYRRFGAGLSVGDTAPYCIVADDGKWQTGIGTYTATDTWQFTTCEQSSNSNAVVTFTADAKLLFVGSPSFAGAVHAFASKTTPVDADELGLVDSAASNGPKRLTWANLKATLLTAPAISGAVLNDGITEEVFAVTDAAGVAISPTNGSIQTWTLTASRTPTLGTWAAGQGVTLFVADGTAYTVTWTTMGVVWVGAAIPALPTSGYAVIELIKVGTTIYGFDCGDVA